MFSYKINNNNLEEIVEKPFAKEVEIHKLCENNLEKIFGLKFVKREDVDWSQSRVIFV